MANTNAFTDQNRNSSLSYQSLPAPYVGLQNIVPSKFWGAPVFQDPVSGQLSCPGFVGNTFATGINNFVVIGDYTTPGICEVIPSKKRDHDVKKAKGKDGARVTTLGIIPAEVEIHITIWTPQQLVELTKLVNIVFPGTTKTTISTHRVLGARTTTTVTPQGSSVVATGGDFDPDVNRNFTTVTKPQLGSTKTHLETTVSTSNEAQPFSVSHPDLELHLIHALYFLDMSGPVDGKAPRSRIFTMKCREYLPPTKNNVTKTATGAVAPKGSKLDVGSFDTPGNSPGSTDP